ncbi:hypothetical protein AB0I28_13060 [Phytomonospora sp. NPDC050363]|uniref:hypothetical protein n=1 Tax=Phytomonospora sp. NPDC050363 TaxID=3155642 RepID=UPI0033E3D458
MRNAKMAELEGLVGQWRITLSDAWFLEPAGTEVTGSATVEWIGEAFIAMRTTLQGELDMVLGRSDARDAYTALYHDDRGVSRVFEMTFDGGNWVLSRADPDFHQRFVATVEPDRISGRWEASEDAGATWRKDFDLVYDRV